MTFSSEASDMEVDNVTEVRVDFDSEQLNRVISGLRSLKDGDSYTIENESHSIKLVIRLFE